MWLVKKQQGINSKFNTDILDQLFDFQPVLQQQQTRSPLSIKETKDQVVVTVALPGYHKKDIKIEYQDEYLRISAEQLSKPDDAETYSEFYHGKVDRQVYVGDINFDEANADFENGLLLIILPKSDVAKPRQLSIS